MPDMIAIAQALNALKAAKDIAETMMGLRDTASFQGKMIEFQSKIIDANNAAFAAQEERLALLEKIGALEAEVARLEAWETEKERYELKQLGSHGIFAYSLKNDAGGSEPAHWICPDCYQNRQKSVLQQVMRAPGRADVRLCQRCEWETYVTGLWYPAHKGSQSDSQRR